MDYFEKKMGERLVMPTGHKNHRAEEELFYASFGETTVRFANLRRWWASWMATPKATVAPEPTGTKVLG